MQIHHITNNLMDGPRLVAAVTRIGMLAFLTLTTIMWGINGWGKIEVNFAFAFLGFFLTFYVLVSPKATVPWLGVRAVSKETATEINQVILKLLLSFMLTAIFLATWSFAASPWNFWALFTLLMALLTWQLIHKEEADITKKLQLGYILICIGLVLLKTMGVDLQSMVGASTVDNVGTKVSKIVAGGDCPDHVQVVEHGARITVGINCPVIVDQRNMRGGFDFVLVDPVLRAETGRQQLVGKEQKRHNDLVTLFANPEGYKRIGRTTLEVELYRAGTGPAEVAKRHGVYTAPIDLTPA